MNKGVKEHKAEGNVRLCNPGPHGGEEHPGANESPDYELSSLQSAFCGVLMGLQSFESIFEYCSIWCDKRELLEDYYIVFQELLGQAETKLDNLGKVLHEGVGPIEVDFDDRLNAKRAWMLEDSKTTSREGASNG